MPIPQRPTPRKKQSALGVIAVGAGLTLAAFFTHRHDDGLLIAGLICLAIGVARLVSEAPNSSAPFPPPSPNPSPKKKS